MEEYGLSTKQNETGNKRIIYGLAILILLFFMPVTVNAGKNEKIGPYSAERVEDTFRYLDEVYINKYPELGLRDTYGTKIDNKVLQNLAELIVQGCDTDEEKANAVCAWLNRNIVYEENSVYPIDTYYERKGQCLGYAQLMQDLLRKLGIKAVVSDGVRGDINSITYNEMLQMAGHAWCFVYLNNEWVLYDPLFFLEPVRDRTLIQNWYYIMTVEWVLPIFENSKTPPVKGSEVPAYFNGKFVIIDQNGDIYAEDIGSTGFIVNNLNVSFEVYLEGYTQWKSKYLLNNPEFLVPGDLYYGRADFYYDGLNHAYIYENGMRASVVTAEWNDQAFFISEGGIMHEVELNFKDYTTMYGKLAVPLGYKGKTLYRESFHEYDYKDYILKWSTDTPEKISIEEDGTITALEAGFAQLHAEVRRIEDDAIMSELRFEIYIYENERIPDYSDKNEDHEHKYDLFVTSTGEEFRTCTEPDCADSYATGNVFKQEEAEPEQKLVMIQYIKGAVQDIYHRLKYMY
ncbi:MAG: transglutaminase domain-containing protein [Lachnospiraceae bacterium]|nr:transglutaminase domain-containing protein [Lachnospiraceae bacterium]